MKVELQMITKTILNYLGETAKLYADANGMVAEKVLGESILSTFSNRAVVLKVVSDDTGDWL